MRIISAVVLILLSALVPWWLLFLCCLVFEWRYHLGFEAVFAALVADLLYGPVIPGMHYRTLLATIVLVLLPVIEFLKTEMRLGRPQGDRSTHTSRRGV